MKSPFNYKSGESFKVWKEVGLGLADMAKRIQSIIIARPIINKLKKHTPANWHISFCYSDCTENQISFWHHSSAKSDIKPSHVFKKLCEDVSRELDTKLTKSYNEWNEKVESLNAKGYYKGHIICVYQYQADQCDFIVEEKTIKQVILTGDCVNF